MPTGHKGQKSPAGVVSNAVQVMKVGDAQSLSAAFPVDVGKSNLSPYAQSLRHLG